jgi:hypothetical protein
MWKVQISCCMSWFASFSNLFTMLMLKKTDTHNIVCCGRRLPPWRHAGACLQEHSGTVLYRWGPEVRVLSIFICYSDSAFRMVTFLYIVHENVVYILCFWIQSACPANSFIYLITITVGRDSSVGVATRYGLGGPGIECRWVYEIVRTRPDRPWGPPSLLYNRNRVFPGGKADGTCR